MNQINLPQIIGKGYREFWNSRHRYLVVKGSRGSKKSCTTSLKIIYNIMKYPGTHALVVRKHDSTQRESTFAQLRWAIRRLKVEHLWKFIVSPLKLIYIPTNQTILFRGLNDPQSIASITVADGHICFLWIEEAYQVTSEEDFNKLDLSIRGEIPSHLFKQIILTFNPWNEGHWLKARFFDNPDKFTCSLTTNYLQNEFLGNDDLELFEQLKIINPRRYRVEGLGEWGISEGLIFENWRLWDSEKDHPLELIRNHRLYHHYNGLDFGYTNDPTAFVAMLRRDGEYKLYVYDEFYKTEMSNKEIYDAIVAKGFKEELIMADSEDPRTINELRRLGLNVEKANKGTGSVLGGIQKLQDYEFVVHPRCKNFISELTNYCWAKDKISGKSINKPIGEFNHLMDASRYATEKLNKFGFKVIM